MEKMIQWEKGAKYWDHAWNPIIGCKKVSEGCANCYAERMAMQYPELQDADGTFAPHRPKCLKNPPQVGVVFAGNLTDLFGEWNCDEAIIEWARDVSPLAVNLFLTKRADRLAEIAECLPDIETTFYGITAENQTRLEERLGALFFFKQCWLSLEPLLGPINFREVMAVVNDIGDDFTKAVDWVVVGAESGKNRRPCKMEWVESVVGQCLHYEIPVFVKQLDINGKLVTDINKFPEHLRIRQVPWSI